VVQNVPTEPIEQLSADPNLLASGSFPYEEVQLLFQLDQNVQACQNMEHAQFVNLSTSIMGSTIGINKYLVSSKHV